MDSHGSCLELAYRVARHVHICMTKADFLETHMQTTKRSRDYSDNVVNLTYWLASVLLNTYESANGHHTHTHQRQRLTLLLAPT